MRHTLPFLLVLCSLLAHADDALIWGDKDKLSPFDYDFEANAKTWSEMQSRLPPYPKPGNFVAISLGSRSSNQYFIDYASVSADQDGVVRYSVVVKSPSGAETVSYEGMRCGTGERKLYAFGHSDKKGGGEWSKNRYARWEPIPGRGYNDFRRELFTHYFCTVEGAVSLPDIQRNLKSGGLYNSD